MPLLSTAPPARPRHPLASPSGATRACPRSPGFGSHRYTWPPAPVSTSVPTLSPSAPPCRSAQVNEQNPVHTDVSPGASYSRDGGRRSAGFCGGPPAGRRTPTARCPLPWALSREVSFTCLPEGPVFFFRDREHVPLPHESGEATGHRDCTRSSVCLSVSQSVTAGRGYAKLSETPKPGPGQPPTAWSTERGHMKRCLTSHQSNTRGRHASPTSAGQNTRCNTPHALTSHAVIRPALSHPTLSHAPCCHSAHAVTRPTLSHALRCHIPLQGAPHCHMLSHGPHRHGRTPSP